MSGPIPTAWEPGEEVKWEGPTGAMMAGRVLSVVESASGEQYVVVRVHDGRATRIGIHGGFLYEPGAQLGHPNTGFRP